MTLLRSLILWLLFGLALATPQPAAADEWHRAESPHFVVYSAMDRDALEKRVVELEWIDAAIRRVRRQDDPPVGDGNRVTIFMIDNAVEVRRLFGREEEFFAGFYAYLPQGPIAYTLRIEGEEAEPRRQLFLHEYNHHLFLQSNAEPMPKWLVEGFAEYFSTAAVDEDGSIMIGRRSQGRTWALRNGAMTPLETLFDERFDAKGDQLDGFYATSWLLTHYFNFNADRRDEFNRYLTLMAEGVPSRLAAPQAFGDIELLERELILYLESPMRFLRVSPDRLKRPDVSITPLSAGDALAVEHYGRLWLEKGDAEILEILRGRSLQYPTAPLLMTALAMAELQHGEPAAADKAARTAMALRPNSAEPMILLGRALIRLADQTDDYDEYSAIYAEAEAMARKAIDLDPLDPEPLRLFHRTRWLQDGRKDEEAIEALALAARLSPQDYGARLNAANALIEIGRPEEARPLVEGIIYEPHQPAVARAAQQILDRIEGREPSTPRISSITPAEE